MNATSISEEWAEQYGASGSIVAAQQNLVAWVDATDAETQALVKSTDYTDATPTTLASKLGERTLTPPLDEVTMTADESPRKSAFAEFDNDAEQATKATTDAAVAAAADDAVVAPVTPEQCPHSQQRAMAVSCLNAAPNLASSVLGLARLLTANLKRKRSGSSPAQCAGDISDITSEAAVGPGASVAVGPEVAHFVDTTRSVHHLVGSALTTSPGNSPTTAAAAGNPHAAMEATIADAPAAEIEDKRMSIAGDKPQQAQLVHCYDSYCASVEHEESLSQRHKRQHTYGLIPDSSCADIELLEGDANANETPRNFSACADTPASGTLSVAPHAAGRYGLIHAVDTEEDEVLRCAAAAARIRAEMGICEPGEHYATVHVDGAQTKTAVDLENAAAISGPANAMTATKWSLWTGRRAGGAGQRLQGAVCKRVARLRATVRGGVTRLVRFTLPYLYADVAHETQTSIEASEPADAQATPDRDTRFAEVDPATHIIGRHLDRGENMDDDMVAAAAERASLSCEATAPDSPTAQDEQSMELETGADAVSVDAVGPVAQSCLAATVVTADADAAAARAASRANDSELRVEPLVGADVAIAGSGDVLVSTCCAMESDAAQERADKSTAGRDSASQDRQHSFESELTDMSSKQGQQCLAPLPAVLSKSIETKRMVSRVDAQAAAAHLLHLAFVAGRWSAGAAAVWLFYVYAISDEY